ncbi:MAG: exo-alpha-sialidase [Lentisphaeria bacterium]|nr:exo-alpha-sialidase [Lentisphaeria bacterium]
MPDASLNPTPAEALPPRACGIEVQVVREGYDRRTCWVQTRAAFLPPKMAVLTTQKLLLTGSDVFYGIHSLHSDDGGRTFSEPVRQPGLDRTPCPDHPGLVQCPCDGTPAYHAASGTVLLTGHTAVYDGDRLARSYRRRLWASVYRPRDRSWSAMQIVSLPEDGDLYSAGGGCTQRVDLPDGDILLPVYGRSRAGMESGEPCARATVLRCRFDGRALVCVDHGPSLTCAQPRGFCEPSLATVRGRFYLTLRNDVRGWVAASADGLHFDAPVPWRFDDGTELGNYNTQQHWLTHADDLFLVYTRRGAGNDHVFRHRAPLFLARVDPERLCVLRDSETRVIPEHGARLGNFGTTAVDRNESWVVVSEWMQTTPPNPHDCSVCERYGSNNRIYIGRARWHDPGTTGPIP